MTESVQNIKTNAKIAVNGMQNSFELQLKRETLVLNSQSDLSKHDAGFFQGSLMPPFFFQGDKLLCKSTITLIMVKALINVKGFTFFLKKAII